MKRVACESDVAILRNFAVSLCEGEERKAVLDGRLGTTQQGVLLASAVSSRYLSSQLAFRLNAKPTWARMLCLLRLPLHSEDTQYLPRTNLWGQWTIKSNHSHFTSTITIQRSSPAFLDSFTESESRRAIKKKKERLLSFDANMASISLLFAPLPSISLGDEIHKTERTSTVHAGIMWHRAAKHFLSTASAGVIVAVLSYNGDSSLFPDKLLKKWFIINHIKNSTERNAS